MGSHRSGASGSANTKKKGKAASNKALPAGNNASTSNDDSPGDFSAEQLALYKVMHAQLAAKKKAATAAEDEGKSILILEGCFGS
jgi:hypothetical protein